jgi:hypothetical protein
MAQTPEKKPPQNTTEASAKSRGIDPTEVRFVEDLSPGGITIISNASFGPPKKKGRS